MTGDTHTTVWVTAFVEFGPSASPADGWNFQVLTGQFMQGRVCDWDSGNPPC